MDNNVCPAVVLAAIRKAKLIILAVCPRASIIIKKGTHIKGVSLFTDSAKLRTPIIGAKLNKVPTTQSSPNINNKLISDAGLAHSGKNEITPFINTVTKAAPKIIVLLLSQVSSAPAESDHESIKSSKDSAIPLIVLL
jgi:hypothetical protein